jgi:hypothetical protein
MPLLRLAFLIFLVIFGGGAVLIGAMTGVSALTSGVVEMSYVANGQTIVERAARASDPARYWRFVVLFSAVPLVLGAISAWLGLRGFRQSNV